jgi:hypothetical protein
MRCTSSAGVFFGVPFWTSKKVHDKDAFKKHIGEVEIQKPVIEI